MDRNLKDYGLLLLKGMGMGAADVVPGVSGGNDSQQEVGIYRFPESGDLTGEE